MCGNCNVADADGLKGARLRQSACGALRSKLPLLSRCEAKSVEGFVARKCAASWVASPRWWRANRLAAHKRFNDDHLPAAVRAEEGWSRQFTGHIGRFGFGHCGGSNIEKLARQREFLPAPVVGDQSEVADAVKPCGQQMQQKAAHELLGRERHRLVARAALVTVVLPAERDATLVQGEQSRVGNCHPVRITRQIGQHGLRSANGRLA